MGNPDFWDEGQMTEQEKILLRGCLKGEKSAWDGFVRQYSNLVYYTIRRTLSHYHVEPNPDIVDDLFQGFFDNPV